MQIDRFLTFVFNFDFLRVCRRYLCWIQKRLRRRYCRWQKRLVVEFGSLARQSACEGSEERQDLGHAVEGHESDPSDKSKQLLKGKDYKTEY